jgi:pimeloyl-ACP methyl ester carboxylesterase
MVRKWATVVALCVGVAACNNPADIGETAGDVVRPVPCSFANAICAERVELSPGWFLPVFTTHSLADGSTQVTRGLIVIHGTNRNADDYFQSGFLAAATAREQDRTVVVSPRFQTSSDGPAEDEPFWTSSGWKRGDLSRPEGPAPRVSSYAALDRIVGRLADRAAFPALTVIVVTGHSAGGQLVHRYAATSRAEELFPGIVFRYVVANPSTYLYLGPERAQGSAFATPEPQGCPEYDDWHYGLRQRNSYAGTYPADTLRAQLSRRDVRILIGSADTLSALLDTSCGANLQGPNRFVRGQTLVRFMDADFPGHHHMEMEVPGVGHSNSQMWLSEVGLAALFEG